MSRRIQAQFRPPPYTTHTVTPKDGRLIVGGGLVPVTPQPKTQGEPPAHDELFLDTWHWVHSLSSGPHGEGSPTPPNLVSDPVTRDRAEALMTVFQRVASFRLHQWRAQLAARGRLNQDMHLLRAILAELSRQHATLIGRLDGEQRARVDRLTSDLHGAIDTLRDITVTSRTDLSLAVNSFRAESREDGQRLEMELHRLEGKLAARISQFKSDSENVKVRSMYSFACTLSWEGESKRAANPRLM